MIVCTNKADFGVWQYRMASQRPKKDRCRTWFGLGSTSMVLGEQHRQNRVRRVFQDIPFPRERFTPGRGQTSETWRARGADKQRFAGGRGGGESCWAVTAASRHRLRFQLQLLLPSHPARAGLVFQARPCRLVQQRWNLCHGFVRRYVLGTQAQASEEIPQFHGNFFFTPVFRSPKELYYFFEWSSRCVHSTCGNKPNSISSSERRGLAFTSISKSRRRSSATHFRTRGDCKLFFLLL